MKNETTKIQYETPQIYEHGDVSEITLNGNATNADSMAGNPNTAFAVIGS